MHKITLARQNYDPEASAEAMQAKMNIASVFYPDPNYAVSVDSNKKVMTFSRSGTADRTIFLPTTTF